MRTQLWGRDHELVSLQRGLSEAVSGHPSAMVVAGEPGVGKTSLLKALAVEVRALGVPVLWAKGIATEDAPPFWLWEQVGAPPRAEGADRFAVYESIRAGVVRDEPVLLIVDDLQWVDESSLQALTYLIRRMNTEPLLVAASLRTDGTSAAWSTRGGEFLAEHAVQRLDVGGLGDEDSERCLREACLRPLPEDEKAAAIGLAGGNPFYLTELGRAWSVGGSGGTASSVPRSVLDVVAVRMERLPNAAQEFLIAASILGDDAEIAVVAHCLGRSTMECLAAVQCALDAQLLEHGPAGFVRFVHGLVRNALTERIPVQRLVALHARAAAAIEELHAESLERHFAELARHHAGAAISGGAARESAVWWSTRAAEAAMQKRAFEQASGLYGLALGCGADSAPAVERARLLLGRAAADFAAARFDEAHTGCREAAGIVARGVDSSLSAQLALTLDAIGERSWDRDVRQWCEDALYLADPDDASLCGRLTARIAEALVYDGRWDEAEGQAVEALALADSSGDDLARVAALRACQLAHSGPEFHAERVHFAQRMTQLGMAMRRPDVELWGRLWRIDACWEQANLAAITAELTRLRWVVAQLGSPTARWHALVTKAALAQARGQSKDALQIGREAFALLQATGHPAGFGAFMSLLGTLGHHFGHEPMSLRPPPGLMPDEGEMRSELFAHLGPAFALAESGRTREAAELYARPGPPASWKIPPFFRVPALATAAHIAVLLERLDDVAFLRAQLEPYRGRHVVGGAGVGSYLGPVELVLGICSASLGELSAGEQDLRSAHEICQAKGVPSYAVEAACELATVLFAQRRGEEARRLLADAASVAGQLGMTPWIQRIEQTLAQPAHALTAREREVARLVARGKSNREIAAQLVLSERTAANHVQHMLTKLGFARRAQIAAWVATNEYVDE